MVVDYIKPIGTGYDSDTGLYNNILYNWFGFEINNFSNFSVTNSLNEIPTVTNIVFTNGTLNIDDYEGTLIRVLAEQIVIKLLNIQLKKHQHLILLHGHQLIQQPQQLFL